MQISDLPAASSILADDVFAIDSNNITRKISWSMLFDKNSYVKDDLNLGSSLTQDQATAISSGSFDGLALGAYWTIDGVTYRIWAFDWYYGKMACNTHHCVIIPDDVMLPAGAGTSYMATSASTSSGYAGSWMRSNYLNSSSTIYNKILSAFTSDHLLTHYEYLSTVGNANGADGFSQYSCVVEIPSEVMMYGCSIYGKGGANSVNTFPILPLAQLRPYYVTARGSSNPLTERRSYWLRDIVNGSAYAFTAYSGAATYGAANVTDPGVRPYFLLK